jgi:DNA polymerase
MKKLHIDIETYSSVPIKTSGAFKYIESLDFEILLIAYAIDDGHIQLIDLANGDQITDDFLIPFNDPNVQLHAHNAAFERWAFERWGMPTYLPRWRCSMVKAAYCGLPLPLDKVSDALKLGKLGKLATGKALIKYFCEPCKPTKVNGGRTRNYPHHDAEKWFQFQSYCINDVAAERELLKRLERYEIPWWEQDNYTVDQTINDRGIMIDRSFAENAKAINERYTEELMAQLKDITGVDNPNSLPQLKEWLSGQVGEEVKSITKDTMPELIEKAGGGAVRDALILRQKLSRSSNKKYTAMLNCISDDDERAHGLFQFYGANRTGRWAGRLVQMQNLKQNHLKHLADVREIVSENDYDLLGMLFDDTADTLSQLIRTAFIAKPGHTFAVADFSAIEARVIAWLAGEEWRLKVFNSHGKIYEASAAMMFNIPIDNVTKEERAKGKVAELALGYQGALGALKAMGGESMGLTEDEMDIIVEKWREKNPAITSLWRNLEGCAKKALRTGQTVTSKHKGLEFAYDGRALTIKLPSGRKLFYWEPTLGTNKYGSEAIKYRGTDQQTGQWAWVDTYGGKLTENVVQAIARDILANSLQRLERNEFKTVMHVHDEAACEVPLDKSPAKDLEKICNIMGSPISWAEGLPLKAEGYITPFYKKD